MPEERERRRNGGHNIGDIEHQNQVDIERSKTTANLMHAGDAIQIQSDHNIEVQATFANEEEKKAIEMTDMADAEGNQKAAAINNEDGEAVLGYEEPEVAKDLKDYTEQEDSMVVAEADNNDQFNTVILNDPPAENFDQPMEEPAAIA